MTRGPVQETLQMFVDAILVSHSDSFEHVPSFLSSHHHSIEIAVSKMTGLDLDLTVQIFATLWNICTHKVFFVTKDLGRRVGCGCFFAGGVITTGAIYIWTL
mmetsp:Transcript_9343/g.16506  ORF Transcript_9343/g.16506 Transcript_9343/m.16506 type:complete len:102 (-) Transcript_9343:489-794(-)